MSNRADLLDKLAHYQPIDDDDRKQAERFAAFVRSEPFCFHRTTLGGHVTGSAWLLSADRRSVLLTQHRKLNKWLQLGGHADGESDLAAVALREAREESGLQDLRLLEPSLFDVDVHLIPATAEEPEHFHFDARFLLGSDDAGTYHVSSESHDLAWVPLDQLSNFTSERSIVRMAEKTARWLKSRWLARPVHDFSP